MYTRMQGWVRDGKANLGRSIRSRVREKAITRAKNRITLSGKEVSKFSEDELESIVKEEEDKIISDMKTKSIYGLLIALGITWI